MAPAERAAEFERVWKFVAEQRNLRAITIAVSRPYLTGDEEAAALLTLALRGALSLPTATIEFEPFARVANDRSLRAREFQARQQEVPAFDLTKSSAELRALVLAHQQRIAVRAQPERWSALLRDWEAEGAKFHLAVAGEQPSTDGVWRVPAHDHAKIELVREPWYARADRVRWSVEVPQYLRCNLTARSDDEALFERGAPPRPRWREIELPEVGETLPVESLREFFDRATGCGALRVKATIESGRCRRETTPIELRRFAGTGFRAALTEQFGLPYLFGSGALRDRSNTGPETGWGADCANFIVYALRRQGLRVPWSNPKQLRRSLETIGTALTFSDEPHFTAAEVERGLLVHLGSHVAAVMEDRPPLGVVDASDIVAHQLEGAPEFVAVGELLRARGKSSFDLLRVPPPVPRTDLVIGGDAMLGRSVGAEIEAGEDPFAGIAAVLRRAGTSMLNLECVVSDQGAARAKKYPLRAPLKAAAALRRAGWDVVGLANNHAADFGSAALVDSIAILRQSGRAVIGAGASPEQAFAAHVFETAGKKIAVLALSDVEGDDSGNIALASDSMRMTEAIAAARRQADVVVALVHWGEENTPAVTDRQRNLARWLVDHGVDLVAGSHSHCVQPLDYYHGRPIVYSLGNLVFDGAPTVPGWNAGQLLEVATSAGASATLRLVPLKLDERGFPHEALPAETAQR